MGGSAPHYVQWGFISITVPDLFVLILMIVVFFAAIALHMPSESDSGRPHNQDTGEAPHE